MFRSIGARILLSRQSTISPTDEPLSGMFECAATSMPSLLLDPVTITVPALNEIHFYWGLWAGGYTRNVHLDGRKHSTGYTRLSYMGESIGWYEGNELVVQTTNFTFDPDGLDDHLHLASSPRKKITERYKLIAPDRLTLTITHDDSLFLKEPFTWSVELMKETRQSSLHDLPAEVTPCDLENARSELELLPDKYRGK